jgi:SAM-dependent methyltransferase
MLADSLRHPKVTLYRCDARVAVDLYEPASFDVVIDNLTHAHWVGATRVKSVAYFAKIRRIVKPVGVFVYHGNYANAREAILAGLARVFPLVQEHRSRVVLASEQPVTLDRGRAEAVLPPRAQEIGLAPPYADWLLTDWRSITRAEVGRRRPIRDDLLIYEYQFDPLRWLVGSRRRQAGSRRDAAARSGFTEASSTPDARESRGTPSQPLTQDQVTRRAGGRHGSRYRATGGLGAHASLGPAPPPGACRSAARSRSWGRT